MGLLAAFGAIAFGLAAAGVYGVVLYSVSRRQREMGIRLALGARPQQVSRLVVGEGMRTIAVGAALGLPAGFFVARLMASILYEVRPPDPPTLIACVGLLALVGLLSCWLPARRAAIADPTVVLRSE